MNSRSLRSLKTLWNYLPNKFRVLFSLVCALSIFAALLEALVILTFVPFISSLTGTVNDSKISILEGFRVVKILNFDSNLLNFLIFICMIILSSGIRLIYIYLTSINSAKIGTYLSKRVYSTNTFEQD